jgi:hypothetical protein
MVPASLRLHAAIVEGRLTLPADAELASHAAHAIAKHSRRGWRLDKANPRDNMDAMIALCMALERAEHREQPVEMLGWGPTTRRTCAHCARCTTPSATGSCVCNVLSARSCGYRVAA